MGLSSLLVACYLQAVAASYTVFVANLAQLDSSGVAGEVTIFVTPSGLFGVGNALGLEASLTASPSGSNCTAKNGCGAHVHSGTACASADTQGGHYYPVNATDPWAPIGYESTTSAGAATFSFSVTTDARDIAGKPFVVHNNNGGRVACGILTEVSGAKEADLMALSGSGVMGSVTIWTTATKVLGAGYASGLEPNLKDGFLGGTNCTATNGCGVHVHSGTACDSTATQGGHYFTGDSDPWSNVRYSSTSAAGYAVFWFSVSSNATDVVGKPFIVHNNNGGRVACGLLESASSQTTTTTTTSSRDSFLPSSSTSFKISMMVALLGGMPLISAAP